MAAAGGGRPGRQQARGKKMRRAVNNIKVALVCAVLTVIVLRGAVGRKLLAHGGASADGSGSDSEVAAADASVVVVEDIERVLREVRSGSDEDEDEDEDAEVETATPAIYGLGPRVTRWNAKRRRWLYQNRGFPSRDARGNPRILLVTGSPPAPCHDPTGDHYLLKSTKNKIDYCRLHGIEILHTMADMDAGDGSTFAKLPLLRRLMLSHPEVEWLWWLDAGALITDMAFELPLARYEVSSLVVHGNPYLLYKRRSPVALSTGSFLLRNCQWSLELLDAWARMRPRGLAGGEADDQAALIHLLLAEKTRWSEKVYLEGEYHLHGHWSALVDRYEEMVAEHHPGLGDDRWPFVTHFAGCNPCGGASAGAGEYPPERCLSGMERAFNFADDQVLRLYGFRHTSLASAEVRRSPRVANRTASMLDEDEADDKSRSETLGKIHQRLWTLLGFLS